jgi:hypothetical protein
VINYLKWHYLGQSKAIISFFKPFWRSLCHSLLGPNELNHFLLQALLEITILCIFLHYNLYFIQKYYVMCTNHHFLVFIFAFLSFAKLVCACIHKSKVQIWASSWFQFQFQLLSIDNNKMVYTLLCMKYIVFKWNKIEFGTLENMWRIDTLQTGQRNKFDYFQLATTHNHY